MNANKKVLTILIVILLIANVVTISLFWFKSDGKPTPMKGGPAKFIIKELGFDKKQQEQYLTLVEAHQKGVKPIRNDIKIAKDNFFNLLHEPKTTENEKLAAAKVVSSYTEKLDLFTLNHFAKVRLICNTNQQKKFDEIIKQVTQMMREHSGGKGPSQGPPPFDDHHPNGSPHDGPPPHDREGNFPPPPQN